MNVDIYTKRAMSNTRLSEDLIHQLEELPLNQLLEVKAKVDSLIVDKSVVFQSTETPVKKTESDVSYLSSTLLESRSLQDVYFQRVRDNLLEQSKSYTELTRILRETSAARALPSVQVWSSNESLAPITRALSLVQVWSSNESSASIVIGKLGFIEQEKKEVEDDSVEKAICLVDKWLKEDSSYDEENYSQIEAGLQENRNLPQK